MKTAMYARISEARDALGVERQLKLLRDRAAREGWDATEYVDNSISGWKVGKVRAGYEAMLAEVAEGRIDAVAVYNEDRLFRQIKETVRFVEACNGHGVRVLVIDGNDIDLSTADGRNYLYQKGLGAMHESDRKSERIRRKNEELRAGGYWTGGGRPYGFDLVRGDEGVQLAVRQDEGDALRAAYQGLVNGRSLRGVAREVPGTTVRGNAWTANTLRQTLLAERNVGTVVDRRTWARVRDILEDPTRQPRGRGERYLLTGYARCAEHGTPLTGRPVNGKRSYVCVHDGRLHLGVRAEPLERHVTDEAVERDPETVKVHDPAKLSAPLLAEQDRLERDLEELGASDLPLAAIRGRARRLQAELDRVTGELEAIAATPEPGYFARLLRDIEEGFDVRPVVELAVDHVDVLPAGKGSHSRPVADRVRITWR